MFNCNLMVSVFAEYGLVITKRLSTFVARHCVKKCRGDDEATC